MDCFLFDGVWEDGMPGRSGHLFTLELKALKKESFLTVAGETKTIYFSVVSIV